MEVRGFARHLEHRGVKSLRRLGEWAAGLSDPNFVRDLEVSRVGSELLEARRVGDYEVVRRELSDITPATVLHRAEELAHMTRVER